MGQYILSITAQDRPGIIADVSQAIFALSGIYKQYSHSYQHQIPLDIEVGIESYQISFGHLPYLIFYIKA